MTAEVAAGVGSGSRIKLDQLWSDPYPTYKLLRENEPICFMPAANRYLVTRHQDVIHVDRHPEIFSNVEPNSLVIRAMGNVLLRKDGADHARQRVPCEPALRPAVIRRRGLPAFTKITNDLLDQIAEKGSGDLVADFASDCAALGLRAILGLPNTTARDLLEWSQAFIDGSSNYGNVPEIWERCDAASRAVDAAISEMISYLKKNPDETILSAMVHADDPLSLDEIQGNIKVFIGGGVNEPRDAISIGAWALLTHPEERARVENDPALWKTVFEETIRWISPIGMYPRFVKTRTELGGVTLDEGSRIGVVIASANRDESAFSNADRFDLSRTKRSHYAFGGGPHYCLGAWASRVLVGEVALPALFARLKGLELDHSEPVRFGGWVFRGALNLPVQWKN
jgi:cytochrome P450